MTNVHMVEPVDPIERATAIRICRLNSYCDPETGEEVDMQNPEVAAKHKLAWDDEKNYLPYAKWIWMWNYGREEWARTSDRSGKP